MPSTTETYLCLTQIYRTLFLAFPVTIIGNFMSASQTNFKKLSPQEERVIVNKRTETPFTGKYFAFWDKGTYVCKRCGAKLYRSENKFEANCGWPSFDEEIPGAVKRMPDPDGKRTEIECVNCGAHLGHVFTGEGFTQKNTRQCVNSISMDFIPDKKS
jgi:methionine-R-sulfoxide reductase